MGSVEIFVLMVRCKFGLFFFNFFNESFVLFKMILILVG